MGTLNTWIDDECCAKQLAKASLKGMLDGRQSWDCPRCGCLWTVRVIEGVNYWEPAPASVLFE